MPTGGGGGGGATKGWPLTYWYNFAAISGGRSVSGVNQVDLAGIVIETSLMFSGITFYVFTTDAVNLYDAGIYTQAGVLLANIGAQGLPSSSWRTFNNVQGAVTVNPGLYLFGITGNSTTGQWGQDSNKQSWIYHNNAASSSGGALPATVPAQTISIGGLALGVQLF